MNVLATEFSLQTSTGRSAKKGKTASSGLNHFAALLDGTAAKQAKSAESKATASPTLAQKSDEALRITQALLARTTANLTESGNAHFTLKDQSTREGEALTGRLNQFRRPETPFEFKPLAGPKKTKPTLDLPKEQLPVEPTKKENSNLDAMLALLSLNLEKTKPKQTPTPPTTPAEAGTKSKTALAPAMGMEPQAPRRSQVNEKVLAELGASMMGRKDPTTLVGDGRVQAGIADLYQRAIGNGTPKSTPQGDSSFAKMRRRGEEGQREEGAGSRMGEEQARRKRSEELPNRAEMVVKVQHQWTRLNPESGGATVVEKTSKIPTEKTTTPNPEESSPTALGKKAIAKSWERTDDRVEAKNQDQAPHGPTTNREAGPAEPPPRFEIPGIKNLNPDMKTMLTPPQPEAAQAPGRAAAVEVPAEPPPPPQPMFSQVESGLRHAYIVRPRSVTVRIVPEELGEIKIQVSFENDKVQAKIQAETQRVVSILEDHQTELQNRMKDQGMPLEKLEISQDTSRDKQNPEQRREPTAFEQGSDQPDGRRRTPNGFGAPGAPQDNAPVTAPERHEPAGVDENGHISITI